MYTYSLEYSTELQSHMLKNSEWGAVAYLTESTYGRNGTEIAQHTNRSYITGSAEGSDGNTYTDYTSTDGQKASSTGNVYGIYDLSGGACEYVTAYYINGGTLLSQNGSSFTNAKISNKYSTVYNISETKEGYKYGDAIYETMGWHSNYALPLYSYAPFYSRGGARSEDDAGIFFYRGQGGYTNSVSYSFRVALCISKMVLFYIVYKIKLQLGASCS